MPMVSAPRVMTNAPLSVCARSGDDARRATVSRTSERFTGSSLFHPNRFHFVVLRNRVHHVLPLPHLSENGVDAVKVRLRRVTDEELAAAGVFPGVGHGERAGDVLVHVLLGLALDGVARSARADAALPAFRVGIAPLNHEVGDHAVELRAVVEAGVGELREIVHRARYLVGKQLHLDPALGGLEYGFLARHHCSRVRFSSTCDSVFIPTITTDTAWLSRTKRRASWAAVTPVSAASSATRDPSAASCAT